jgi:hypothetical protein
MQFADFFSSTRRSKDKRSGDVSEPSGPETLPEKMNLEERMAFRRELLFEAVRSTLNSEFIRPGSYRFKVMQTDKRGHCYFVMIDMCPEFMLSERGQHKQLGVIAATLCKNALGRYGLVVKNVYWRLDEELVGGAAEQIPPSTPEAHVAPSDTAGDIEKHKRATAAQLAEFETAWEKNSPVRIDERTYASDLAPLKEEPSR